MGNRLGVPQKRIPDMLRIEVVGVAIRGKLLRHFLRRIALRYP